MLRLFKYRRLKQQYPGREDYLDMGFGIEARYSRCRKYWRPHLNLSRLFVNSLIEVPGGSSLAVLGAGRLYDIDLKELSKKFKKIALYDCDPGVMPYWKKAKRVIAPGCQLDFHLAELTGSIDRWSDKLSDFLGRNPAADLKILGDFLLSLECGAAVELFGFDAAVSLNLLSQIPIYWRDRVNNLFEKYLDLYVDDNGCYEPALQAALEESMARLQSQHIEILNGSGFSRVVLIYDKAFLYYQQDKSLWQEERAVFCNSTSLSNYHPVLESSWFWHIAPQGVEQPDYGVIHDVTATHYAVKE
ncbi:MAG: hypothetical protein D6719_08830 [Candidatus Dadabacteria bacterium]|nr:MAG: hypothetical protein D6719_08830 [Candidatus Dadabacteria bacterium]